MAISKVCVGHKSTIQSVDNDLIRLLLKRQAELNSLLELTQAINRNSGIKELLAMLHVILKVHLNIKKMRLYFKKDQIFYCLTGFGNEQVPEMKFYRNQALGKEICMVSDQKTDFRTDFYHYDYFVPIVHQRKLSAFVVLTNIEDEQSLIQHDLTFIQTLTSLIVVAQQHKKLRRDKIERERLEQELELGRQVQHMLIPHHLNTNKLVEVSAWYQPHESIGGDYFDFDQINENEWMWCIADVSGKGISAALLMANLQASLRAWFSITSNPVEVVKRLNELIWKNTQGERYITLFLGVYDCQKSILNYVNAGHQPSVLFQQGESRLLKTGTVMMGVFEELPFIEMGTEKLCSGDLIFNYTDGLLERKNLDEHISEQFITDFLKNNLTLPVQEMHQALLKYIRDSIKTKGLADDLTLLSIKVK
ncbi:MAG: SpoIIE family protein phosphatase [Sphingobacteriaceae bacterium]